MIVYYMNGYLKVKFPIYIVFMKLCNNLFF
jgi:hypothetical protein